MRGILMFAHNNGLFDYGKMAYAAALAAKHYIGEKICLVTDDETYYPLLNAYPGVYDTFDDTIFITHEAKNIRRFDLKDGSSEKASYHNTTRLRAYELSPYTETLLIDTDVLVQDSTLTEVWNTDAHIRMNHSVSSMVQVYDEAVRKYAMEERAIDVLWATICYFRKGPVAEEFFRVCEYVEENYHYYGTLYGFVSSIIRVDFIMSIAAHIMSGYIHGSRGVVEPLPCEETLFAWNKDIMVDVQQGRATFLSQRGSEMFPVVANRTVHCMNKDSMLSQADKIIECYA